jgi:ATP-dependent Clp protease protease subunit
VRPAKPHESLPPGLRDAVAEAAARVAAALACPERAEPVEGPATLSSDVGATPAPHLARLRTTDHPGAPVDDPPTAPTRKDIAPEVRKPQSRVRKPASERREPPAWPPDGPGASGAIFRETRGVPESATAKVEARAPEPAKAPGRPAPPPGAQRVVMGETRGIPAAKPAPPPEKPPDRPRAPAKPEQESGTLASFVSATRKFLKKFTGAPPEVRIQLPTGDLRLFRIAGELDDRLVVQASTWLLFVQAMKPDADVTLAVDSPGGSVTAGLSLIEVMLKSTLRVRTHCARQALGICSIVLAAGTKGFRTMSKSALLSVPGAPISGDGKTTSVVSPRVVDAVAQATGRPKSVVEKEILRLRAVGAKQAVKYGIVDAVAV